MRKNYKKTALFLAIVFFAEVLFSNNAFCADIFGSVFSTVVDDLSLSGASLEIDLDETVSASSLATEDIVNSSRKYSSLNPVERTLLTRDYGVRQESMETCQRYGLSIKKSIPVAQLMQRLSADIDDAFEMIEAYGDTNAALNEAAKLIEYSRRCEFLSDLSTYREFSELLVQGRKTDELICAYVFADLAGIDLKDAVAADSETDISYTLNDGAAVSPSFLQTYFDYVCLSADFEEEAAEEAVEEAAEEAPEEEAAEAPEAREELTEVIENAPEEVQEEVTEESEYISETSEPETDLIESEEFFGETEDETEPESYSADESAEESSDPQTEETEEAKPSEVEVIYDEEIAELAEYYSIDYAALYRYVSEKDLNSDEIAERLYLRAAELGIIDESAISTLADDDDEETIDPPLAFKAGEGYSVSYEHGTTSFTNNLVSLPGAKNLDLNLNLYWEGSQESSKTFGQFRLGLPKLSSSQSYAIPSLTISKPSYVFLESSAGAYTLARNNGELTGQLLGRAYDDIMYEADNNSVVEFTYNGYTHTSKFMLKYQNGNVDYFDSSGMIIRRTNIYGQSIDFRYTNSAHTTLRIVDSVGNIIDMTINNSELGTYAENVSIKTSGGTVQKYLSYYYSSSDSTMTRTEYTNGSSGTALRTVYGFETLSYTAYNSSGVSHRYYNRLLKSIETPTGMTTSFSYSRPDDAEFSVYAPQYFLSRVEQTSSDFSGTYYENYTYNYFTYRNYTYALSCTVENPKNTTTYSMSGGRLGIKEVSSPDLDYDMGFRYDYNYSKKLHNGSYQYVYAAEPCATADYVVTGDLNTTGTNLPNTHYKNIYHSNVNKYGNLTSYIYNNGGSSAEYSYNDLGNVTKALVYETLDTGYCTTYTYDSTGAYLQSEVTYYGTISRHVFTSTALVAKTTYTNNDYGYPTTVNRFYTSGSHIASNLTYSGVTGLVTSTTTVSVTEKYTYDMFGHVLTYTDGKNQKTSYSYDSLGALLKVTYADGTSITNTVNYLSNDITVKNENGKSFYYDFDAFGNLLSVKDDGKTAITTYTYDLCGRVATVKNGEANATTTYTYDGMDRVIAQKTVDSSGSLLYNETTNYACINVQDYALKYKDNELEHYLYYTTMALYNGETIQICASGYEHIFLGTKVTKKVQKDSSGAVVSTYEIYDNHDRLVESGNGKVTTVYEYNLANLASSTTNGLETDYTYNYYGDVTETSIDGGNIVYKNEYDLLGRQTKAYTPEGVVNNYYTAYTYDSLDRLTKVTAPLDASQNIVTTYSYDNNSNVITETVAGGSSGNRVTTYTYDSRNRVTKATQGSGTNTIYTSYTYDNLGNVLTTVTGNGTRKVTNTYDSRSRLTSREWPDGKTETYAYDKNNNMTKKVDRNGNTITYTYDGLNRLTKQASGDDVNNFTYNMLGSMASQSNANTTISYAYNIYGLVSSESYNINNQNYKHIYNYNSNLYLSSFVKQSVSGDTATTLNTVAYSYDAYNRLTTVKENGSTVATYVYNKDSNVTSYTMGNGVTTSYAYNKAGLTTSLANKKGTTTLSSYTYTYYADGNQKTKTDNSGLTTTYTYDIFNRLTKEADNSGESKTYTYDAASNRTRMSVVDSDDSYLINYIYDLNNRLLTESRAYDDKMEKTEYHYDNNGNLTERYYNTIYDEEQTEASVAVFAADSVQNTNSGSSKLAYEGYTYNNFNQLTRYTGNGSTATYSYRADGLRYEKTVNGTTTYFGWQGDNIVTEYNKSGAVTNNYTRGLNLIKNSNSEYYVFDAHNDVIQLTNSSGTITKDYTYDAFGNESDISDSDTNPFRYCGQYYDDETGFIYLRARYYNPATGSFTTEDPAFDGVNWYSYCGGNPVNFSDLTGLKTDETNEAFNAIARESLEKYESGEIAPMAYSHVMNLFYHYYLTDNEDSENFYLEEAQKFQDTGYTTTNGEYLYVDEGIEFMQTRPTDPDLTPEEHYFRNKLNLSYSWNDLQKLQENLPDEFKWDDSVSADYHQNHQVDGEKNIKYVSADGHFEIVYDANHVLLAEYNNPDDMGTYNYYAPNRNPLESINHYRFDVLPYEDSLIGKGYGNVEK